METRERRLIEILIGAVFVLLLLLIVFLVVGGSAPKTEVTNSYNTYNIYSAPQTRDVSVKPYIVDKGDYYKIYYVSDDFKYLKSYDEYLDYSYDGRLKIVEGVFGNNIYRYEVFVKNRESVGGYFKVIFYFKDYYGKTKSEVVTHYIPAQEEKLFVLKDVSPSDYKYRSWWYEVESLTKIPEKFYSN